MHVGIRTHCPAGRCPFVVNSSMYMHCEIDESVVDLPQWCEHHLNLPRFKYAIHTMFEWNGQSSSMDMSTCVKYSNSKTID